MRLLCVSRVNGSPCLDRGALQQTSNLALGVDSEARVVATHVTLEVVVVGDVGCRSLWVLVLFGASTGYIYLWLVYLSHTIGLYNGDIYPGAGVRNLPTTGIPSVERGF